MAGASPSAELRFSGAAARPIAARITPKLVQLMAKPTIRPVPTIMPGSLGTRPVTARPAQ